VEVLDAVEHHGAPAVAQQVRGGCGRLDDRAGRGEVAAEHGDSALGNQGGRPGADDLTVPDLGIIEVADQRLAGDGES
jgi:hypothetical protein